MRRTFIYFEKEEASLKTCPKITLRRKGFTTDVRTLKISESLHNLLSYTFSYQSVYGLMKLLS